MGSKKYEHRIQPVTPEQQQEFIAWLREKWKNDQKKCPICLTGDWIVEKYFLWSGPLSTDGTWAIGGNLPLFPYIAVHCKNCGYTMKFNAVTMGFFPPHPEQEKTKRDDQTEEKDSNV